MANVIKHKRGSGSDPAANNLVIGELAIRTDNGKLFTKMDSGAIAEIAGGGSDIAINTLSSSSATGGGSATFNGSAYRFTLSSPPSVSAAQLLVSVNGVIQKPVAGTGQPSEGFSVSGNDIIFGDAPATGADFFILTFRSLGVSEPADNSVTTAKIAANAVTMAKLDNSTGIVLPGNIGVQAANMYSNAVTTAVIADSAITNAKVNANAAIAGTKISPDFGSQAITTTGNCTFSDVTLENAQPSLILSDNNAESDFALQNRGGVFTVRDIDNNANRFQVDSSGQVGMGTTSPAQQAGRGLHINGTDQARLKLTNASSGATANDGFDIILENGLDTHILNHENGDLKLGTNDAERMRIDSSGNVGIGTTSPSQKLHVSGSAPEILLEHTGGNDMTLTTSDGMGMNGITVNGGFLSLAYNNKNVVMCRTGGSVGIGTTSPGNVLDVQGSGHSKILVGTTGTGHATGLQISHAIGDGALQQWQLQTDATADGNLLIRNATTGNKVMIFDSDVYGVSIGGIDPEKMFELGASNNGITDATEARNTLRFRCNDSTINTNQPMGTILWTTNDSGNSSGKAAFITATDVDSTGKGQLLFGTGNPASERMRILGNGRLCVGTTSTTGLGGQTGANNVSTFNQSGITLTQYGVTAGFYYDRLNFTNSQYFIVNSSGTGVYLGNGSTSFTAHSDERLKENITELDGTKAYNHVKNARAASFKWKATGYPTDTKIGFIAQDWETNYPEVTNSTTETIDEVKNPKGIQYTETIPVLMAALKQAIIKIETLETKVAALEAK